MQIISHLILMASLVISLSAFSADQTAVGSSPFQIVLDPSGLSQPKDDCVDLYVQGYVQTADTFQRIEGVLVTGSYLDDEGVGNILYYDHKSYAPGPLDFNPNFGTESHAVTGPDGTFTIRIDVCPHGVIWEADFWVCASKDGFTQQCLTADFDQTDDTVDRFFSLAGAAAPTPTPTQTMLPTPTPTETLAPTPTPTITNTPVPGPTAVHPELDVDGDGIIGPGDLLLLIQDWMRPVGSNHRRANK
ncbi:MAG: hypothetical protein AMXMBFR75_10240 [Candidatus Hinthialibacteria bacterium]